MKTKSQKQQILELLLQGHQLSKLQILQKVGCWNSGNEVMKLRREGHPIKTRMEKLHGTNKKFAVYYI